MNAFHAVVHQKAERTKPPVLCQMSSLGYLNMKWLKKIYEAIDYQSTHGADPVKDYGRVSKNRIPLQNEIRIVWPTVEEIKNSVEGYHGGGSVCGKAKNVSLEFLQPLYRRWSNVGKNPLQTSRHVPHIKTFLQPSHDGRSIEWLCLTSHNLSIAAWGQVQKRSKNQSTDEKILFIRHWELGVFISAATLARGDGKQVRIVPLADHENDNTGVICLNSDDEDGQDYDVIRVPLPYSLHTPAYDNKGNPWTDDPVLHQQPDAFGRHGLL
jgi:tyrosyl-DNA phosphodiesterase-1